MATFSLQEMYLGDGLHVSHDGKYISLRFNVSVQRFIMAPACIQTFEQIIQHLKRGSSNADPLAIEADVWHEGTKSYYVAKLVRKLTIDEVYARCTK